MLTPFNRINEAKPGIGTDPISAQLMQPAQQRPRSQSFNGLTRGEHKSSQFASVNAGDS
jgi:hypothetical protein